MIGFFFLFENSSRNNVLEELERKEPRDQRTMRGCCYGPNEIAEG
jgi:hypothetical protein